MKIIISNVKNQPIYEQIYEQIKNLIITEELKAGEMLPSIRGLAKDLRISVIKTKRAYDELEKDGFINSVAGKGCFVGEESGAYQGGEFKEGRTIFGESSEAFKNMWVNKR